MNKSLLFLFISFSLNAQANLTNAGQVVEASTFNEIISKINNIEKNLPPIGSVIAMPGNCPSDYLLADGASLIKTEYNKLFLIIGTNHGSNDNSSFNLPDYRGFFLRGADNGAGIDPQANNRVAMKSGGVTSGVGSIQLSEIKEHSHSIQRRSNSAASFFDGGDARRAENSAMTTDRPAITTFNINTSGGTESRPKNAYINYCIKYN